MEWMIYTNVYLLMPIAHCISLYVRDGYRMRERVDAKLARTQNNNNRGIELAFGCGAISVQNWPYTTKPTKQKHKKKNSEYTYGCRFVVFDQSLRRAQHRILN